MTIDTQNIPQWRPISPVFLLYIYIYLINKIIENGDQFWGTDDFELIMF